MNTIKLDVSPSILCIHYDEDRNLLYYYGKVCMVQSVSIFLLMASVGLSVSLRFSYRCVFHYAMSLDCTGLFQIVCLKFLCSLCCSR